MPVSRVRRIAFALLDEHARFVIPSRCHRCAKVTRPNSSAALGLAMPVINFAGELLDMRWIGEKARLQAGDAVTHRIRLPEVRRTERNRAPAARLSPSLLADQHVGAVAGKNDFRQRTGKA